jgi:hypothetical protein
MLALLLGYRKKNAIEKVYMEIFRENIPLTLFEG